MPTAALPASAYYIARQFDNKSKELANGWMYVYASGTDTLIDLYSDEVGTQIANPYQLDGAGKFRFFGDPQACKVVVEDLYHTQIDSADPVWLFGPGSGGNGSGSFAVVANYTELRSLTVDYSAVVVCGRNTEDDGGQGLFFQSTISTPDNDGTILTASTTTRYVRDYIGYIEPAWFGVQYNVNTDQIASIKKADAVGVVQFSGQMNITTTNSLTGTYAFLPGSGFYTSGSPTLYMNGKILQGAPGIFGSGINVVVGHSVCDTIYSSWFNSIAQSICTIYNYDFVFDADVPNQVTSFIYPKNFAVDFIGGSRIIVTGLCNIEIDNLKYTGIQQIIKYNSASFIGTIRFNENVYAYLEWFGGVSGTNPLIDNRIPYQAALAVGKIQLYDPYYTVLNTGSIITTNQTLYIQGTGTNVLNSAQSVTVTYFNANQCKLTGSGAYNTTTNADLLQVNIQGVAMQTSASTQNGNGVVFQPGVFVTAGVSGIRYSSNLSTWTSPSGITDTLDSICHGPVWVAAGQSGRIWTSKDGGETYTSITLGSVQINKTVYLNKTYFAIGNSGTLYSSVDAITWNNHSISTSSNLKDMIWNGTTYLVVGTSATLYGSVDGITYISRSTGGSVTGDFNTINYYTGATSCHIIAGTVNSSTSYLRSTDLGYTWTVYLLPAVTAVNIYASASYALANTICLVGSTGLAWVSVDNGITFHSEVVNDILTLLSITVTNGIWFIGATAGNIFQSNDLINYSAGTIGTGGDVNGVALTASVYAIVGNSNSVQTSFDTVNWTSVTVDGSTANWNNCIVLNGISFLLGESGRLFQTTDFVNFKQIQVQGTTNGLFDIVYNSTTTKYTVSGENGYIATTADITDPTPTWTNPGTTATSNTLTCMVWDGTRYTLATSSNIYQGTNVSTTAPVVETTVINGIVVIPGVTATYIAFGNSGAVFTSSDLLNWTIRTSGTTANLLCGIYAGGNIVLGGASGTVVYSVGATGGTWSTGTTGFSGSITSMQLYPTGNIIASTSGTGIYISTSGGATWSNPVTHLYQPDGSTTYTGTPDFNCVWLNGSTYCIVGTGGTAFHSTDRASWTQYTTGVTTTLYAGEGNNIVGAAGTFLYIRPSSTLIQNYTSIFNLTSINFKCINQSNVLGDNGIVYITNATMQMMSPGDLVDATTVNLAYDSTNTQMIAVGANLWTSQVATSYLHWVKILVAPVGVLDLELVSGIMYITGTNGLYASSVNGLFWKNLSRLYDTSSHYSVLYYQAGELQQNFVVTAYASGTYGIVLAGPSGSVISGGSLTEPLITALGYVNCDTVNSNVEISCIAPGTIRSSILYNVLAVGAVSDSTFTNFSGTVCGNIVRTNITATATISTAFVTQVIISESNISKTDATDPMRLPLLSGTANWQFDSTDIEYNGTMMYSTNTSQTVYINDCTNTGNFSTALTNGYAKVYLNRSGGQLNSTAWSVDGMALTGNSTVIGTTTYPTSTTTNWYGLPGTTISGNVMTLGSTVTLSSDPTSNSTFRFAGTDSTFQLLEQLGGVIKMEIVYPSGFTPLANSQVLCKLVRPVQNINSTNSPYFVGPANQTLDLGNSTPVGITVLAGKVTSYTYVWGGLSKVVECSTLYGTTSFTDSYGDVTTAITVGGPGTIPQSSRLVVYAQGSAQLPAGTTIQITLVPELPTTQSAFSSFFNAADNSVDSFQKVEKQALSFVSSDISGIRVVRNTNSASAITTDLEYLSFGTQPLAFEATHYLKYPLDAFQISYTNPVTGIPVVYLYPTDKSQLYPSIAGANKYIEIALRGLADSAITTQLYGQYYLSGSAINTAEIYGPGGSGMGSYDPTKLYWYGKPRKHVIENGTWNWVFEPNAKNINGIITV
jgi:hypothetical protein